MKTSKLTTILFLLLLLLNSCEKENKQTNIDFLQSEWKVQSVANENERINVPSDNNQNKKAYALKFDNDSSFYLVSVNK